MDLRPHPLYIWYDARKWIWLLLIPVLRALFSPRDAVYILLSSIRRGDRPAAHRVFRPQVARG